MLVMEQEGISYILLVIRLFFWVLDLLGFIIIVKLGVPGDCYVYQVATTFSVEIPGLWF